VIGTCHPFTAFRAGSRHVGIIGEASRPADSLVAAARRQANR